MSSKRSLVVIPTYNEAENIEAFVRAVHAAQPQIHVLVVDDSSPDGTADLVRSEQDAVNEGWLHLMVRAEKQGLGMAYAAGFSWALERDYDNIISMDADFSHDPKYLDGMLVALGETDVAIGSRYVPGGGTRNWAWHRRFLSRCGGIYARMVLGLPVQDVTAGFVGYRRQVLESMDFDDLLLVGFGFQIEMKYRAHRMGCEFSEVPIIFPDREEGESKMHGGIVSEALVSVWQLRGHVR